MGRCYIHKKVEVEVKVGVVEIGGGMAKEEVDKVHNGLTLGSKKVEAAEGIPIQEGPSTSLHQSRKTSKPSACIVESLATLK